MKKILDIFRLKQEERIPTMVATLLMAALIALPIYAYSDALTPISDNFRKIVIAHFRISGFDPLSYLVLTDWGTFYNVYRHPLLAFFMYPPYLLNQALTWLTGHNCAIYVMGALQLLCSCYSFVFMYRILREIIGLKRIETIVMSYYLFSLAYVMVTFISPDHFAMSMPVLMMTLYISGICIKKRRALTIWQTVLLFALTAGISLNNGLKTFMAALFCNGKRFFRLKYLLLAVIAPSLLIWLFARFEYRKFVWPAEMARKEAKMKKDKAWRDKVYTQYRDTTKLTDTAQIRANVNQYINQKISAKYKRDHQKAWMVNKGKPIAKGEFMSWTDKTTSRWETIVENLFGESIQLHSKHLLEDTLVQRPLIVKYGAWYFYCIELIVVLLFVCGIIAGARSRFLWLVMSFFGFDMLLHMGLGFGINEVYIMSAHWIYAIPIATSCLLKRSQGVARHALLVILTLLTIYLWSYNATLVVQYFT